MKKINSHDEILTTILDLLRNQPEYSIPVGVSNRHIHLSHMDSDRLFGQGYNLTKSNDLSQPGQYACKETLTICGPKGAIEKVRVLGPFRSKTQLEILASDCYRLGINAPVKCSGDFEGTSGGITLVGPAGSVYMECGIMVAQRHIHMTNSDAAHFGVYDGQVVSIEVNGSRSGVLHDAVIRANDASLLECHLDMEEANALGVNASSNVVIKK